MARRGVRCGDGGDDDHAVTLAHALGGVNGLAAAHADNARALVLRGHFPEPFHFLAGALAPEVAGNELHAERFGGLVQLVFHALHVAVQRDQKRGIAKGLDEIAQVQQFVLALHVLRGANKGFSHSNLLKIDFCQWFLQKISTGRLPSPAYAPAFPARFSRRHTQPRNEVPSRP